MKPYRQASGFTLIEALIAVLVLSIGLLGVAAMQLKALQSAHIGYQRSVASLIAIDAQERAWERLSQNGTCPEASEINNWVDDWSNTLEITNNDALTGGGVGNDCEYSVKLEWDEGRLSVDEVFQAFEYQFRLPILSGS
jgi:type IV pilus assembly protein PilV